MPLFFAVFHVTIHIMNIQELLEYGRTNLIEKEEPYRLAKMLLKHLFQQDESYFLIHNEEQVDNETVEAYKKDAELLKQGKPIQYITHHQEFMGLPFYVDENVLIPQPDTETLVEEVLKNCKNKENLSILDLCTGSGAIGISLVKHIKNSQVTLTDVSKNALEIARKNAESNGVIEQCEFVLSNMFEKIEGKFDIIVSNPPYIQTSVIATLDKEVQNEPKLALDGGADGLDFYRVIAENAWKYLKPNGILALEIGYDQKDEVIQLLEQTKHYREIVCKKDLGGNDRVVICKTYF